MCVCTYDTNRPLSIVICLSFSGVSCVCVGVSLDRNRPFLPCSLCLSYQESAAAPSEGSHSEEVVRPRCVCLCFVWGRGVSQKWR